jgi:hypothetical protein
MTKHAAGLKQSSRSATRRSGVSGLTFYAIDGEETHTQYFDPDDAIAIQHHRDGSQTIHVAIVDSTHVEKNSPEYKRAAKMGESKYAPVYTPMLSLDTNKRLGLKNGANDALLTSIHLSAGGEILDTSFSRTSVQVQLLTHKQATEALAAGTHKDLNDLSHVANVLYSSREARTQRVEYDARTGMRLGAEGDISYRSASSYNVHKIIGEMMKLSNHATAQWADKAHLPFIFRNCVGSQDMHFDIGDLSRFEKNTPAREETRQKIITLINTPATFGAVNRGHGHMKLDAYAFTTSPLRRYADMVNQKQLDYAIQVEQVVETALRAGASEQVQHRGDGQDKLSQFVWKHMAQEVMPLLVAAHTPSGAHSRESAQAQLKGIFGALQQKAMQSGVIDRPIDTQHVAQDVLSLKPLYYPLEIAQIGEGLNYTLKASEESKRRSSIDRMDRWLKKVIAQPDAAILREASREDFTSLLERAAITGQMNQELHDETIARLEAGGRLKPYKAYAGILFLAPNDEGDAGLWKNLKRRVLEDLRFNNKAMTQLSDMLSNSSQKINLNIGAPIFSDMQLSDAQGNPVHAAHYVLRVNDAVLSPPDYTVMPDGHQGIAKSEALFNLVHSLAYNKLVPVEQVAMPDALTTSIKRIALPMDLLRSIAKEHHLGLTTSVSASKRRGNEGYTAKLSLTMPNGEMITEHRFAPNSTEESADISSSEDALRRAAQRLLRHAQLKPFMPADTYVDYSAPEDPLKALSEVAAANRLHVHFSQPESLIENHQLVYRVGLNITQPHQHDSAHPQHCIYFQDHVNADSKERAHYVLAKQALDTLREQNLVETPVVAEHRKPSTWAQRHRSVAAQQGGFGIT